MGETYLSRLVCPILLFLIFLFSSFTALCAQENPDAFIKIAENGYIPFWAPDGKHLVYGGRGASICVFKVRISDGYVEQMTKQRGFHPVVSPDGKYITYDSLGAQGTLLNISFLDGTPAPLSKERVAGNFSYWSPDGAARVYTNR